MYYYRHGRHRKSQLNIHECRLRLSQKIPPFQVNSEARASSSSASEGEPPKLYIMFCRLNFPHVVRGALHSHQTDFTLFFASQPRLNSSSEEPGLNDERSLTVRRFPNSENRPSQVVRIQSTPEHLGNKVERSPPDFLSVSVSSPGLLSHASDLGESLEIFTHTCAITCSCGNQASV